MTLATPARGRKELHSTNLVTHSCELLARLIHRQAFEWDANSEKFVSCFHSVPQPKQPSVELPSAFAPQGSPVVGRRSVLSGRSDWSLPNALDKERGRAAIGPSRLLQQHS
jgi:GTP-dependent phosphoenolpyruvate carboxykinase